MAWLDDVFVLAICSIFLLLCDANLITDGDNATGNYYHDQKYPFDGKVLRVLVVHVISTVLYKN